MDSMGQRRRLANMDTSIVVYGAHLRCGGFEGLRVFHFYIDTTRGCESIYVTNLVFKFHATYQAPTLTTHIYSFNCSVQFWSLALVNHVHSIMLSLPRYCRTPSATHFTILLARGVSTHLQNLPNSYPLLIPYLCW